MITPNDIADVIQEKVEKAFPDEPVYRDLTPAGFKRPSTLIVYSEGICRPNFACGVVEMRPVFTLMGFVPVDAYSQSHLSALNRKQHLLLSLFLPGFLCVGDRAPKVGNEIKLDGGYDFTAIDVPIIYTLNRDEFMDLAQYEPMGHLHIRTEVTSHG